ncbi:GRB10-interacting GYF protein 2-like, partial [Anoplophora glabripennis]|uniref:GRB10-interacting GYF protein 2-like n=1 Tax=Anoplophora glabripennis TaxID=217634 RepID=UPI0008740FB5
GLSKEANENTQSKENNVIVERKKSVPNIPEKIDKEVIVQERAKSEGPPKPSDKQPVITNGPVQDIQRNDESDFERLQEDFVLKLVVDEEPPKQAPSNFEMAGLQPPPNLVAPVHDKWFYQDPQGQMQGPFSNIEMAEWYKAGYFSNQLKVRRQCDERFFLLGELITICGGANPFQTGIRFPTLKNDVSKMPDPDILQFQYLSQMAAYKQAQARILAEPWSAITLQQQELAAQRLIMQQQQVSQDLQFIQQPPPTNPLMHMINQMQQANKLPAQGLVEKQPQNISPIDPHLQLHMGNILSLQNRIPPSAGISNHMQTGLPSNLSGSLPPESLSTSMPSLQSNALNAGGMSLPGMQTNIPVSLGGNINIPRPTSHGSVDQINTSQDNDPISNLLKQLQQNQQSQQVDSLWQQNQYSVPNSAPPQQWQSHQEVPLSMWDMQQGNTVSPPTIQSENKQQLQSSKQKNEKEKEQQKIKDESSGKELKKKKEQDEKQAKKEAEDRRRHEQKRQPPLLPIFPSECSASKEQLVFCYYSPIDPILSIFVRLEALFSQDVVPCIETDSNPME